MQLSMMTLSAVQRKPYGSEQAVAIGPDICRYKRCEQPRTVLTKQGDRRTVVLPMPASAYDRYLVPTAADAEETL